jgi:mannose-6-phosphate isomerase-like protein (cupin superfamily)
LIASRRRLEALPQLDWCHCQSMLPGPDAIAPDGSDIYFKVLDAKHASVVEVVLALGRTTRAVRHRTVEEIWYILAGSGDVWMRAPDDSRSETRAVGRGDTVVIPTGWDFQFRARGEEPLRFLCYTSPPWPGEDDAILLEDGGLGEPTV